MSIRPVLKALLAGGADKNARTTVGATALHIAAWRGHAVGVEVLLSAGADKHAKNKYGRTALDLAKEEHGKFALQKSSGLYSSVYSDAAKEKKYAAVVALLAAKSGSANTGIFSWLKGKKAPHHPKPAAGDGWYLTASKDNRVRQVVVTLPPTCAYGSKFGGLILFPHYRVTQKNWLTEVFTLDGDPGPYLIVRADGVTQKLRGHPVRLAYCFYHMHKSGIFGLLVNVDCPEKTCRDIGFDNIGFETAIGLDTPRALKLYGDFIARPETRVCFAEGTSGQFDMVTPIPADCRAILNREWEALRAYHSSLHKPDFQAGVQEMYKFNPEPQRQCPILQPR